MIDNGGADTYLSLVIPAYNESERIGATLDTVSAYLNAQPYGSEIVVVDDGSTDDTSGIIERGFPHVRVIRYAPNRGKGFAVKRGMTDAVGEVRVFYDADASTPIEELEKILPRIDAGADIAIGSRSIPGAQVERHQAWYRENMGRIFNVVLRMLGMTTFVDTQCGFKGFTRDACEVVFPRQTVDGFSFDAELLLIAKRHGLRIDEVPVRWCNSPDTRLNAVTDSVRMLVEIVKVRMNAWRGLYD